MSKSAFKRANLTPYYWNGLSEPQQAELTSYLDALKLIINNDSLDPNTILPASPDFLNDLLV